MLKKVLKVNSYNAIIFSLFLTDITLMQSNGGIYLKTLQIY